ncbi:major inositol transporter-like SP family MFS transporter [Clostridium algifaecis]|uniref:Major inositol transporter-like SP family MFS transporter n=1 Tax=Clostridium algifaecis TaxID=1472040 RepID=A0ABS4KS16_9CLOT|nr:sugar porter family MFS transporter [Clostridium algifaecis]MBP2032822.1 major inositol transporter-like SP family MFS transporter [Clostridium algifaecis]
MIKNIQGHDTKKTIRKIAVISTLGGLLFGYDTGVVNGALTYMKRPDQLNLSPTAEGLVTSSLLLGAAFGAMFGGRLSDKYGRKSVIKALAVVFFISTLGCSFSPTSNVIISFRFILGLAVGGASVIVPTFLAEIAPAKLRGSIVTQNEMMIVTGQLLAYVFNAILGNVFGDTAGIWRYMIAIASIPAVFLWFGMFMLPETPRWLAANGKVAKALEVLKQIREEAEAEAELEEIQKNIDEEKNLDKATFRELSTPWIRRLVLIGCVIGIIVQFSGINVMMYYGTTILEKSGLGTRAALVANIGNGITSCIGVLVFIKLLSDRFGRKRLFLIGLSGTTIAMIAMTIVTSTISKSYLLPVLVMCCTITYLAFYQSCLGPLAWLLESEIFPLRLRGLGMGIAVFVLWISNFLVGLLFPIMLARFGLSGSFISFAIFSILGFIFMWRFCPETRGKSLEEIEQSFREYKKPEKEML